MHERVPIKPPKIRRFTTFPVKEKIQLVIIMMDHENHDDQRSKK